MKPALSALIKSYNPGDPLERAATIPAGWYFDQDLHDREMERVFCETWQLAARVAQLRSPGDFVTNEVAGEPIVVVRGNDNVLRGFFNVCRHHAAAVITESAGHTSKLRCPYHGWTYSLEGELKGTPDFSGVCDFNPKDNSLIPLQISEWENWVFVKVSNNNQSMPDFLTDDLTHEIRSLDLGRLHWFERRQYNFDCNWKVFVDNYLDGGYHIPHLHKGLDSVLDYSNYQIENGERHCLQWSPLVTEGAEAQTGAVRRGNRALYYWIFPNFMINYYEGVMDTNLVLPRGVDQTEVIFDFYFPDISESARANNLASIEVGQRIQDEDVAICKSVQRGLRSKAYDSGRLSVRREAGEHLFHRLLFNSLTAS